MDSYTITSRENKTYKRIKALKDKKQREKEGVFLVEGERGVRDAIKNGLSPETVVLCEGCAINIHGANPVIFARRLFGELAETQTPQGIIAVFPMPRADFGNIRGGEKSFVMMCENIQDPGNLGTIIRTAHCAGAEAIVLTKGCCDLFNPKTVRSTVASIASIPVIRGVEAAEAVIRLKKMGYRIAAGALTDKSQGLYNTDLSGKIAFVVGNEGNGITPQTLAAADIAVKIPMTDGAESLNAGVAAAVMMYEKVRVNRK
ncbi:MAG: TrmH family RNA methyltransferase [Clostridia bacterium]